MIGTETAKRIARQQLWSARLALLRHGVGQNASLFLRSRIGVVGLAIIVGFGLLALAHPILMRTIWDGPTYDPVTGYDLALTQQPAPPSLSHPLGTDPLGRDVLSQLMFSARAAFALGVTAAAVTVAIATLVGAVSAYYGGLVDTFFMRLADLVVLFPVISLLIVLTALFEMNLLQLAVVLGILGGFGATTIIIRSQALAIKVRPYIDAARMAGGGHLHIIFSHLIPNLLPLSLLYMMFTVTSAIFAEAVLSFFGLLDIRMSWGIMIHTAQVGGYLLGGTQFWWLLVPAGLSITLLCAAFYLVGRGLDEVVNPRLRRR
ncbi:MAG: ABC transporter permease [Dehalococcoidia bacterium]